MPWPSGTLSSVRSGRSWAGDSLLAAVSAGGGVSTVGAAVVSAAGGGGAGKGAGGAVSRSRAQRAANAKARPATAKRIHTVRRCCPVLGSGRVVGPYAEGRGTGRAVSSDSTGARAARLGAGASRVTSGAGRTDGGWGGGCGGGAS